eukprot:5197880-Pyramimonas_sp.AAC.1
MPASCAKPAAVARVALDLHGEPSPGPWAVEIMTLLSRARPSTGGACQTNENIVRGTCCTCFNVYLTVFIFRGKSACRRTWPT